MNAEPAACKVCGGQSPLFGVVDFSRNCERIALPLSGIPVYYRRCQNCGLLFTDAFDAWSDADFEARIYNKDYGAVDPDFGESRPASNAAFAEQMFGASRSILDVLDYGGGNGLTAERLRQNGFRSAATYDAFYAGFRERPQRRFNLVTCFETLEHMNDPVAGAADVVALMETDGVLVFSTLLQPEDFNSLGMQWWYIGPRNGHITLHSRQSIRRLFGRFGLQVASFGSGMHMAYRTVPAFARHLFQGSRPT